MTAREAALTASVLLGWVALVHLLMASGLRLGELVWAGQQPRLLQPELRVRSMLFGLGVAGSAVVLAFATGILESPIPHRWDRSATFGVTAFLGVGLAYCLFVGSRWERMLFAPILFLGASFAGWLTFG